MNREKHNATRARELFVHIHGSLVVEERSGVTKGRSKGMGGWQWEGTG